MLLNSNRTQLRQLNSQVLSSHTPHTLHKFAHLLTLSSLQGKANCRLDRKSKPFTLVGVPEFYRDSVFLLPTYSSSGVPVPRKRATRSAFFRKRAFEVYSTNSSRVLGSYNRVTRYETSPNIGVRGIPNSVKRVLGDNRRSRMTLALQLFLIIRRRSSVNYRLRSIKFRSPSFHSSFEPSRTRKAPIPGSKFFLRNHVQDYVTDTYGDLPKTISRTLRDFTTTLFPSFYSSCRSVLRRNSAVFTTWLSLWTRLVLSYVAFSLLPPVELYLRAKKSRRIIVKHHLRFRFNRQRLVITLADEATRTTHVFISPGLFLKYFQRKKSLKKSRSMKVLMARFMRKVLLILRLEHVVINSRGVPVYLDSLVSVLFRPFSHPFYDPTSGSTINEVESGKGNLNIAGILVTAVRPYGFQKTRKMGRVKRKIRRRITRLGNVID